MQTNYLKDTILRVQKILSDQKVAFHFTGGLAASFYGEPRLTQDVDVVVQIQNEKAGQIIKSLSEKFSVESSVAKEAIKNKRLFQAIDEANMVKIDLHIGEKIPGELTRSKKSELFQGCKVPLVSVEDSILSKLIWIKEGSEKAIKDVQTIFKAQKNIDKSYLEQKAQELGIETQLHQFLN